MHRDRENELMRRLQIEGILKISEVVDFLQISESTARRLFAKMEKEKKIIRVHGGIRYVGNPLLEYSFEQVVKTQIEEKRAIGVMACNQLRDGDVIFCDAGTTLLCFCMELAKRMEDNPVDIRLYTNSLANFEVLASKMPLTLIGGEYRINRRDFSGFLAENALSKVHFTKCFLGTDGCDMKGYFTAADFDTVRMGEIVVRNSDEVIVLCGSDKFSSCSFAAYAKFSDVDKIFTDDQIEPKKKQKLESYGMKIFVASVRKEERVD